MDGEEKQVSLGKAAQKPWDLDKWFKERFEKDWSLTPREAVKEFMYSFEVWPVFWDLYYEKAQKAKKKLRKQRYRQKIKEKRKLERNKEKQIEKWFIKRFENNWEVTPKRAAEEFIYYHDTTYSMWPYFYRIARRVKKRLWIQRKQEEKRREKKQRETDGNGT